jgi:hypothetical protein
MTFELAASAVVALTAIVSTVVCLRGDGYRRIPSRRA